MGGVGPHCEEFWGVGGCRSFICEEFCGRGNVGSHRSLGTIGGGGGGGPHCFVRNFVA